MTKVNVISGFLGAGKTTFIKELLNKVFKGEKVVLIENEFGEIGIDGSFLKEVGIEITEMNSGCICCSLVGDFAEALKKVLDEYNPDRILIEPSGVGKLSDVEKAIEGVEGIELAGGITVVDAKKAKKYLKNFGEFFNNQVEYADTVVLSRTDDIDEDKLHECLHIVRDLNHKATIITTPWNDIDADTLTKALTEKNAPEDMVDHVHADHHHHDHEHHHDDHGECCHHEHHYEEHEHEHEHDENCTCGCHDHDHDHHHHHHHADEVFSSLGAETIHKYNKEDLEKILHEFAYNKTYGTVLRSKGILSLEDGTWVEFDLVPEEIEFRTCNPGFTGSIVVIGSELNEEEIKKALYL